MEFSEILALATVVLLALVFVAASYVLHRISLAYARFVFRTFSHKHLLFGFLMTVLLVVITAVLLVSEMHPPKQ
jgi:hypothetical protein